GEEVWLRRPGTDYAVVSLHAAPLHDASGTRTGAVLACADVTARHEAERAAAEEGRLRDRFMTVLGHDLRGPLTAVLVSAETLRRRLVGDEQLASERILSSARRMQRLIRDLLDLSRTREGAGLPLDRTDTD